MRMRTLAMVLAVCAVAAIPFVYGRLTERARLVADLQNAGLAVDAAAPLPALRLQWFVAAQRIDPIFAIDGTDPDELRQSLSVLSEKKAAFSSYYPALEQIALNSLYPKGFLEALPDLEEKRSELLLHPSMAAAQNYQDQLKKTIDAYRAGARSLSAQIRVSTSTKATFVFIGQNTTIDAFTNALAQLARAASSQYAKASQRYACLSSYSFGCESLQQLLRARAASIDVPSKSAAPDAHARSMDALLARINAQMWPPYAKRALPPLIAEHSPCYPYPTSYVRLWWETLPEGGDARKESVANDIYLDDVVPEINPVYAEAFAQGARYKYQISGHYYLCVDSGIEVARTGGDLAVYSLLRERGIFASSTDADLAAQERKITSAVYIDPHDVAQYVHDAAARIATRGYGSLTSEIGADNVDRLEHLIAQYREGGAGFDEVVREAAFESEFMSLFQKQERIPVFALLLLRSYASVLFLAGNASFTAQPPSFASGVDTHPLSFSRMTSYHALLAAGSTSAQVVGALLDTARIERSILPLQSQ